MKLSLSMLPTDWIIYGLLLLAIIAVLNARRKPHLRDTWQQLKKNRIAMVAAGILAIFVVVALLDSLHFQCEQPKKNSITRTVSLLDLLFGDLSIMHEKTYSAPLADHLYTRSIFTNRQGEKIVGHEPLIYPHHLLGTDKVGNDIFYQTIKSVRTAVLIGTLTTVFMMPFALLLGMAAGFFGGWIDDIIQYLYTTLSSIPGVLLISASILVMQVYINAHPHWFPTLAQRADARLLTLCIILGITSWSNLCRILRAETLKLRELEFVQAAKVMGINHFSILLRHLMPNLMHIVLITLILDFSSLVLAEAVLSYVGVGVDPTTASWGNMINASRLELAREPVVWWPLCSAMFFMFSLVLAANLFSDAVCEALNPRTRQTTSSE